MNSQDQAILANIAREILTPFFEDLGDKLDAILAVLEEPKAVNSAEPKLITAIYIPYDCESLKQAEGFKCDPNAMFKEFRKRYIAETFEPILCPTGTIFVDGYRKSRAKNPNYEERYNKMASYIAETAIYESAFFVKSEPVA